MAKKAETKEIVKKESNLPAVPEGTWGADNIDPTDVLIPRLLLMQGLSDFVSEGKANVGDIVRSTTEEIVAKRGESVVFIPLVSQKAWRVSERVGERFEWRKNELWTPDNANRDMTWKENGAEWRADRVLNIFVLLKEDIEKEAMALAEIEKTGEMPEGDNVLIPCQLQFMRTSYNAGKKLITEFAKARKFRKPPAAWMYKLSSKAEKNDQGTYHVLDIQPGGLTSKEHVATAYGWFQTINQSSVQVHEAAAEGRPDEPPSGLEVMNMEEPPPPEMQY